jgi:hypothetical protein
MLLLRSKDPSSASALILSSGGSGRKLSGVHLLNREK